MFGINPTELIIIFLIILLLFGAKRIPEIAQGIGKGISEFKKATKDEPKEIPQAERKEEPVQRIENKPS